MGPFADERAVAALNHQLGADRPILMQYWEWISHFVRGDMGLSYAYREPRSSPLSPTALGNSSKLAAVAFVSSCRSASRAASGRLCTPEAD